MEEIVKHYLEEDVLIEKYTKAEERYLKKLGDKYETIQIDLDYMSEEEIKKIFRALANAEICLDDYLVSCLKKFIVEKEMEKL